MAKISNSIIRVLMSRRTVPFYAGLTTFLLGIFCVALSSMGHYATIWLGNAALLVILLRSRRKEIIDILIMGLLGNILSSYYMGATWLFSVGVSIANLLEVLPACWMLRRQQAESYTLNEFDYRLFELAIYVITGCLLSALVGSLVLVAYGVTNLDLLVLSWFAADATAMLVILPLGLSITWDRLADLFTAKSMSEFSILFFIAGVITTISLTAPGGRYVIMMLPLLVVAFRQGILGVAIINLLDSALFTLLFRFSENNDSNAALLVMTNGYFLMGITILPPLIIAILLNQRNIYSRQVSENERRWKFALEGGGQGVWDWDSRTDAVYFSHTWKDMLGYGEADIKNHLEEWTSRVHPDDIDRVMQLVGDHLAGRSEEYVSEHRLRCKDGSYKWVLDRGMVITRDEQGNPVRVIGTHTDIDAMKRVELEMSKLTQRMALAIDAAKVGIFEYDLEKNYLTWDERMHELYDIPPELFTHNFEAWSNTIYPDDYKRTINEYHDAVNGVKSFDTEFRIVTPLGEIKHIRANAAILRDINGKPILMLGTNWDITRERQLSFDLFQEKEKLKITLNSIGDAVIVTNANKEIEFINPRAEKMLACTSDYSKGKRFTDICHLMSESTNEFVESPIVKCFNLKETIYQDNEVILINRNGERFFIQSSAAPVKSASGLVIGVVMIIHDVTVNRNLRIELQHFATHDPLTGLINRREFETVLTNYLDDGRGVNLNHVLLYIDLDRFKIVNDTAGHAAGDELLRQISKLIKNAIRDSDILARIGGDEFAIILPKCNQENAILIANKIIHAVSEYRFAWENRVYTIGVSIGLAVFSPRSEPKEELMRRADIACYHAKNNGGNIFSAYDEGNDDHAKYRSEIKMLAGIKQSIEEKRLVLYAQEIRPVDISGVNKPYYEILLRWLDQDGKVMPPSRFISIAERHNQMALIDEWVARKALIEYGKRIAEIPGFAISINLSAKSIDSNVFLNNLQKMIADSPIPKTRIGFELTETSVINHLRNAAEFLRLIEKEGCFVALDDFGVGLSSFNYLKHFPAKYVKIDGSFIRHLRENNIDKAIVESINELVHRLGGYTIAEYVESQEIMDVVSNIGIDYVQGHYIGLERPLETLLNEFDQKS